jgi:glycosyltransferase involved in cell wall biosynthesis
VDTDRFTPAATTPSGPPVINFVGRTGIEKAPDLLLSAAIRLAARTKNFALQILGSNHWGRLELDDYQNKLASLAAELEALGIPVRRPGHIDRASLPAELQKAHIHVVPSRWDEPFGLVTLEGMACGLATVASATGGTPEIIGEAGLLFERDSVEALTDQLFKLVENEPYRREVAVQCRRRAEEFTWTRAWDRLRGVLAA